MYYERKIRWKYPSIWKPPQKTSKCDENCDLSNKSIDDDAVRRPTSLRKDRTKTEKKLTVEKMICTRLLNVEMVFKNEICFRKAKKSFEISIFEMSNVFEMKKLLEISTVEMSNVSKWKIFPEYQLLKRLMHVYEFFLIRFFLIFFFFICVLIFFKFRGGHYFLRDRLMVGTYERARNRHSKTYWNMLRDDSHSET